MFSGVRKFKAKNLKMSFYPQEGQPHLPDQAQPQPDPPAAPVPPPGLQEHVEELIQHTVEELLQHMEGKREEMRDLLAGMVARHSLRLEEMVVEQVTRTERRLEGELRDVARRLEHLEGPTAPKRPRKELLRPEELKKEL